MEPEPQLVPPVVAVVVVHEPGPWFEETLDAFAEQDYPNLRYLFLVTPTVDGGADSETTSGPDGGSDTAVDTEALITRYIPDAFVRSLPANAGFGPAVNEVLHLVEGDNGFFLICHDDVAPEPDALRAMVEELYRSNAGAVGPKLVEWDDPGVLQSVGLGLDRFGEIDPVIEPGEVDQEQHDGVRDVFVVPSAFMLIRADLFRQLAGFDPAIDFHGEDVELCWRLHHDGARVLVVPSARVRHAGRLEQRRPDLNHRMLDARHRVRTVATMTGASRLPGRSIEMVGLTLTGLIVGLFTGRFGQAWASLRALVGLVPRTPAILARRREVRDVRQVPEREVASLQERGSARLNSYLRSRDTATYAGADIPVRRWRESATAPVIAWLVVVGGLIVGSRSFFDGGVPAVGEFLPFPNSPRLMLDSFLSGWNGSGVGATSPNPTGWATLWGLSPFTLFHMGMLHTAFILGLVLVGVGGMWKLATVFPSARARVGAILVYAASPLVSGALSSGQLTVLVVYAATPWVIHLLRRAAGIETADPRSADLDMADGVVELSWTDQIRRTLGAALVLALATAFAPVMLPLALALTLVMALGTLVALAPWRTALQWLGVGAAATLGAAVLNLPWILSWSWVGVVGSPPIGDPGRGLVDLASLHIGTTDFAGLVLALYLPVIAAVALARAWRLTWAIRSGALVLVFGALAVLADRGSWPFAAPEAGVLLVPVAVGLGVSAAAALAAFDLDVRGGSFGWRQPLGLLASVAVIVGIAPGVAALGDGSWNTPSTPLSRLIDASLPPASPDGDYNVLLLGDARVLPVPSTEYRDGMSWAIIDDGPLDTRDRWMAPDEDAAALISAALDQMSASSTLRAGRLLAPLAIRYIVIPEFDGVVSTTTDPLPTPAGLVNSLQDQLDLVANRGLPTLTVFENRAWLPTHSILEGATAQASRSAGAEELVRADLAQATAAFVGADQFGDTTQQVPAGVVYLAVPFDDHWTLDVGGTSIAPRRAFGVTTAFDVGSPGVATLRYDSPPTRTLWVIFQTVLWLAAIFGAARITVKWGRRSRVEIADETLIDLDADPSGPLGLPPPDRRVHPGFDPGLDITGQLSRPQQSETHGAETGTGAAADTGTGAVTRAPAGIADDPDEAATE